MNNCFLQDNISALDSASDSTSDSALVADVQAINSVSMGTLLLSIVLITLTGSLVGGCDLLGEEAPSLDVPPERLVALTAVYEETHPNGRPLHRLVIADVENPSDYEVISAAGTNVGRSCFGPDKKRLLFEDHSESTSFSRVPIKLLDLETRTVRDLDATGTLKGCVWRADGQGFYFAAGSLAGLTVSTAYDLQTDETDVFAQSEGGATVIPYGRKGRDSILVQSNDPLAPGPTDRPAFYFVDADTGTYLTQIENEHLRFVPREDPDRGAWSQSVFVPAYNSEQNLIAFRLNNSENVANIAISSIDGHFFEVYGESPEHIDSFPKWITGEEVLFQRKNRTSTLFQTHRVMVANTRAGEISEFVDPNQIDGAVALRAPDY